MMEFKRAMALFLLPLSFTFYVLATSVLGVVGSALQLLIGVAVIVFLIWALVRLLSDNTKT